MVEGRRLLIGWDQKFSKLWRITIRKSLTQSGLGWKAIRELRTWERVAACHSVERFLFMIYSSLKKCWRFKYAAFFLGDCSLIYRPLPYARLQQTHYPFAS
jgi:hypothetical protein